MVEEEHLESSDKIVEENGSRKCCGGGDCFTAPIHWFKMLASEMHWSLVLGVILVYGISQGFGGALARVATEYYMKDVQKVQPSAAQIYGGITSIPWIVKPLWGLLTDVVPIFGYRRRPYFMLAGKVLALFTFTLLYFCSMEPFPFLDCVVDLYIDLLLFL